MHTPNKTLPKLTLCSATCYQIEVQALLKGQCAAMFDGLQVVTNPAGGITTLTGSVADQSALHGVLMKIRDLGLPLISVMRVAPENSWEKG